MSSLGPVLICGRHLVTLGNHSTTFRNRTCSGGRSAILVAVPPPKRGTVVTDRRPHTMNARCTWLACPAAMCARPGIRQLAAGAVAWGGGFGMGDPDLIFRAQQAGGGVDGAWARWRTMHGLGADPLPPVSSYVGYSLEEPWGQPRVVFGIDAREAEQLTALLDRHDCAGPVYAAVASRAGGRAEDTADASAADADHHRAARRVLLPAQAQPVPPERERPPEPPQPEAPLAPLEPPAQRDSGPRDEREPGRGSGGARGGGGARRGAGGGRAGRGGRRAESAGALGRPRGASPGGRPGS